MHRIIPILAGVLFRLGGDGHIPFLWVRGWNAKLWRWLLIGIVVGLLAWKGVLALLLSTIFYLIATNVFSYGDGSPISNLPKPWRHVLSGFMYGLPSMFTLGVGWGVLQALVSSGVFYGVMLLDDKNIVKNPWVERLRGFGGTILYFK